MTFGSIILGVRALVATLALLIGIFIPALGAGLAVAVPMLELEITIVRLGHIVEMLKRLVLITLLDLLFVVLLVLQF